MAQDLQHSQNPLSYDDILKKVISVISLLLSQQEGKAMSIEPSEHLISESRLDSFNLIQLVLELETQFAIEFSPGELTTEIFDVPERTADLISKKLA